MKKKILLLLFALIAIVSQATTYYIDPGGTDGAGISGSIAAPWKTLQYACTRVTTAGDIIHVNAGTYTEISQSSLALGVSIEGVGPTSIIHSHVGGSSHTITLYSATEGTNGNQHISDLRFEGSSLLAYAAIYIGRRSNVHIHDCEFVDFNYMAINVFGGGAYDVEPTTYATGIEISGCTIDNCSKYYWNGVGNPKDNGWGYGAIMTNGTEGMLIYNNTLTQDSRAVGENGYLIKGADYGFHKGLKIYNNVITKLGLTGDETSSNRTWDFAIELWNCRGGVEIYDNTITGGGVDLSGHFGSLFGAPYTYGAYIHDNDIGYASISKSYYTAGIFLEYSQETVIIEKNYIHDVCTGIWCPISGDPTGLYEVRISYNIFENMGVADGGYDGSGGAIDVLGGETSGTSGVDGMYIYNNVMLGYQGAQTTAYGIQIPSQSGGVIHVYIRNNIIRYFDYGPISLGTVSTSAITDNIMRNNGSSNVPSYSGSCTVSDNLTSDPLFVSTTDYHLQATSPALNAGYDVDLPTDYDGVAVHATTPEIGAYEYVAPGGASLPTVSSTSVTRIATISALGAGNVTNDGGASVTERGVCWGVSTNPTTAGSHTTSGSGTGAFTASISGLSKNTTYFMRAYAINSAGTAYGANIEFKTTNYLIVVY